MSCAEGERRLARANGGVNVAVTELRGLEPGLSATVVTIDVTVVMAGEQVGSAVYVENVRDLYPPPTIKDCCNTSVLGLRYRTSIDSKWR